VRHVRQLRIEPASAAAFLLPAQVPDDLPTDRERLALDELPAGRPALDLLVRLASSNRALKMA
jgi:hypothetical protein